MAQELGAWPRNRVESIFGMKTRIKRESVCPFGYVRTGSAVGTRRGEKLSTRTSVNVEMPAARHVKAENEGYTIDLSHGFLLHRGPCGQARKRSLLEGWKELIRRKWNPGSVFRRSRGNGQCSDVRERMNCPSPATEAVEQGLQKRGKPRGQQAIESGWTGRDAQSDNLKKSLQTQELLHTPRIGESLRR